ncbi:MAG: ATP-binding protein, partial [Planctomycetaceae bacterium]|nr:ATP-binding protein [Planctomycetaceae bacterium]
MPAAPLPGGAGEGASGPSPGPSVPRDVIEIRLPSRADFLGAVRSVVRGVLEECLQVRVPEEDVQRIQIALQEACINVVRHAHRGDPGKPLVVRIVARPDLLVLEVEDLG